MSERRNNPNILIVGSPGTGKSTLAQQLSEKWQYEWIDISKFAKDNNLLDGWDDELNCAILDDDRVIDELDERMSVPEGGHIVDYHSSDFFPERWFDLVIVLRTDNTVLYQRLASRGYNPHKISENISHEIMQVALDEARESYAEDIVHELHNNSVEDLEKNLVRVSELITSWLSDGA